MKPGTHGDRGGARNGIGRQRRRSLGAGAGAALALALSACVAGMLHYLGQRHYARTDLSRERFYALSDTTLRMLEGLTNSVEVTVVFRNGEELHDLTRLLAEYQTASPRVRVTRIDPDRDIVRLKELAQTRPLTEVNAVIVESAGRVRILGSGDLSEFERHVGGQGVERRRRAFRGEQALTSAIYEVCRTRAPVVYALGGHGERPLDGAERNQGFAQAARLIRQEGIDLRPLIVGGDTGIPDDADVLLVAGPRTRVPQPELDAIHAFLERNGRALILLDAGASTGFEGLLRRWGLRVGADVAVDEGRALSGGLVISRFFRHGATATIRDLACVLYSPRSVEPDPTTTAPQAGADRPRVTRLATTSEQGWAETDPEQRPPKFDEGRDRPGPITVAAAVERGPAGGIDVHIRPTRLVVFGDSAFVANGAIVSGNGDLFLGALNWLLDRKDRIAIASRPIRDTRIDISRARLRQLGFAVVAGLPGLAAAAGLLVWFRRRA